MTTLRSFLRRHRLWAAPLVAALCCAASAVWYTHARGNPDLAFSTARDAALTQGRSDIAVLSSMDGAHPDASLGSWLTVTSGPLHSSLRGESAADAAAMTSSGATLRAVVTDAALTELDARAGTARMIATVELNVVHGPAQAGQQRKRFEATLERTGSAGTTWKVTELSTVAVGTA